MKVRPVTLAAVIGVVLAAATLALLMVSALGSFEHTCEVCMSFGGRTGCRSASGRTPEEATRTATDNACGVIGARGMAESIECQNTPPVSVSCQDDGARP